MASRYTSSPPAARTVQSQNSQRASQQSLSAAGSCSPAAFESKSELRKLTPRMHRSFKAGSCAPSSGQVGSNLGCLVTAFLLPKPVLSGFGLERFGWEAAERRGHGVILFPTYLPQQNHSGSYHSGGVS